MALVNESFLRLTNLIPVKGISPFVIAFETTTMHEIVT